MKNSVYLAILLLLGCFVPTSAPHASELLKISIENGREIIALDVPEQSPRKVFLLPSPNRLVVDVPSLKGHPAVSLPSSYDGDLIKGVRFGQFTPDTSRFVFDLNEPVHVADTAEEDEGLVITIISASGKLEQAAEKPVRKEPEKIQAARLPEKPQASLPPPIVFKSARPMGKPAPEPEKKQEAAELPGKPVIVIDPGHGGIDPGTIGPDGTYEKDVTLQYAKALRARLSKSGHYIVRLTRGDDQFIMLRKRVDIGRQDHGNIFISLHADSAPELEAHGLSVYTLSERASDEETEALAARENKADVLAGVNLSDERDDVAGILISLAERETKNRSATLADMLIKHLQDRVALLSNTHRFAGFAVLKAPDVPSVLVEIGFLSHPHEEQMIKSREYRDKVVSGIAAGIDAYFRQLKVTERK